MGMTEERLRDKFRGALLGTMVGDALGEPCEGWDCARLNDTLDSLPDLPKPERTVTTDVLGLITGAEVAPGTARYTDDTEMALGLAESLAQHKSIRQPELAQTFAHNMNGMRGYGVGAYGVLNAIRDGATWYEPAEQLFGGMGSFGNGAAMRVAPLGAFYHNAPPDILRLAAEQQAVITHTHLLGIEGAVMQAAAVARALRFDTEAEDFDPDFFLTIISAHLRDDLDEYLDACDLVRRLLREPLPITEVADLVESGLEAHQSVPGALYAFLAHHDSFAEAVMYAVRLGGDADTVGAMCGAISGALLGYSAIPPNWLAALENGPRGRDYALDLADELFNAWKLQNPA